MLDTTLLVAIVLVLALVALAGTGLVLRRAKQRYWHLYRRLEEAQRRIETVSDLLLEVRQIAAAHGEQIDRLERDLAARLDARCDRLERQVRILQLSGEVRDGERENSLAPATAQRLGRHLADLAADNLREPVR